MSEHGRPGPLWPHKAALRRELPRFLVVGGACFGLNCAILYASQNWLHVHYLVGVLLCFLIVNAVGFTLNRAFTFASTPVPTARGLVRFYATMSASAVASLALFYVAVDWAGLHYLVANALITAILFLGNYLATRYFVFRRRT